MNKECKKEGIAVDDQDKIAKENEKKELEKLHKKTKETVLRNKRIARLQEKI